MDNPGDRQPPAFTWRHLRALFAVVGVLIGVCAGCELATFVAPLVGP